MDSAVLRTCSAFVILFFAGIFHLSHAPAQTPSPNPQNDNSSKDRVWLAVEEQPRGQLRIEPIATVEDSVLTPVQTSCLSSEQTPDDFSADFLQSGRKYSLLFGGASFGEGQVGEENRNAGIASLLYSGPLKIRGQLRALATNAQPGDFRVASREPATAEQRASALALAREIFSQHGIPRGSSAQSPGRICHSHLSRAFPAAQPDRLPSLSTRATTKALSTTLFFVADQPGEKLAAGTPLDASLRKRNRRRACFVSSTTRTCSEPARTKLSPNSSLSKRRLIVT